MKKIYECGKCASRCAIVCNECTYVASPDGSESKPRYYVEYNNIFKKEPSQAVNELADFLLSQIEIGEALPIAAVMEYNRRVESNKENAP